MYSLLDVHALGDGLVSVHSDQDNFVMALTIDSNPDSSVLPEELEQLVLSLLGGRFKLLAISDDVEVHFG